MTALASVLDKILKHKADEVAHRQRQLPLRELLAMTADQPACRGFYQQLKAVSAERSAVIAEIKKASPSKGLIRPDFDPVAIAQSYADGGAACLSVLTDEYFFQGHDKFLLAARDAVALPVLRKDFTLGRYQLYEARVLGADAVLLIVAALDNTLLFDLTAEAMDIGLDVLVEVHNEQEMQIALAAQSPLIGVNNRNLHNFETDLDNSIQLAKMLSADQLLVSESGIHTLADVHRLQAAGIKSFLIGEVFMRAADPGQALAELFDSDGQTV